MYFTSLSSKWFGMRTGAECYSYVISRMNNVVGYSCTWTPHKLRWMDRLLISLTRQCFLLLPSTSREPLSLFTPSRWLSFSVKLSYHKIPDIYLYLLFCFFLEVWGKSIIPPSWGTVDSFCYFQTKTFDLSGGLNLRSGGGTNPKWFFHQKNIQGNSPTDEQWKVRHSLVCFDSTGLHDGLSVSSTLWERVDSSNETLKVNLLITPNTSTSICCPDFVPPLSHTISHALLRACSSKYFSSLCSHSAGFLDRSLGPISHLTISSLLFYYYFFNSKL